MKPPGPQEHFIPRGAGFCQRHGMPYHGVGSAARLRAPDFVGLLDALVVYSEPLFGT